MREAPQVQNDRNMVEIFAFTSQLKNDVISVRGSAEPSSHLVSLDISANANCIKNKQTTDLQLST